MDLERKIAGLGASKGCLDTMKMALTIKLQHALKHAKHTNAC